MRSRDNQFGFLDRKRINLWTIFGGNSKSGKRERWIELPWVVLVAESMVPQDWLAGATQGSVH